MGHTSQALPRRVLVEMTGIEPVVAEAGRFTVSCHTITAASPNMHNIDVYNNPIIVYIYVYLEMPDISKLAPQTRVERVTNRLTVCYSTD